MNGKLLLLALTLPVIPPATSSYRSPHFVVEAQDAELAGKIARTAERQLQEISKQWLGREQPDWPEPCLISVTVGSDQCRGSTTFTGDSGGILRQEMHMEGSLDRILGGVLPHEITHLVLMQHFRRHVSRWADEGSATLAEGSAERTRYRDQMAQLLTMPRRCMPLRELFGMEQYPRDLFAFYSMGSSISCYLVDMKDRRTFLALVDDGMGGDWDSALRKYYGFQSVEELEKAWLTHLHKENQPRQTVLARPEQLRAPREVRPSRGDDKRAAAVSMP